MSNVRKVGIFRVSCPETSFGTDKIVTAGRMLPFVDHSPLSNTPLCISLAMLPLLSCIFLGLSGTSAINYYEAQELGPCPHVLPAPDVTLEQLKGKWHLSVVVLDATKDDIEENSVCINGEVFIHNETHMKHIWDMYTPHHQELPVGTFELDMDVLRPGVWTVQTPLGSQMSGFLFGYDLDLAMAAFCGWQNGQQVHLFTAAATREGVLTSPLRLKMSSILLDNGYEPSTTKLIVWNKC